MIFSINFLINIPAIMLLACLCLAGCAGVDPPPPLTITVLEIAPQGELVARRGAMHWDISTTGGQGRANYEVRALKAGSERIVHANAPATGRWSPKEAGRYRLKIVVTDEGGSRVDSGWTDEYQFAPLLDKDSLYAVLPLENLSDSNAPLFDIQARLRAGLTARGFQLLAPDLLEEFMAKYRMRNMGGINSNLSQQMQAELGVSAVFISSLETWQDTASPRVSIISRVVSTGNQPEIIWIDSVGLTGEDAPGLLGLGRIEDSRLLLVKAWDKLLVSWQSYLAGQHPEYLHTIRHLDSGRGSMPDETVEANLAIERVRLQQINAADWTADETSKSVKGRYHPQFFYRASNFNPAEQYRVAVVPLLNINARKHAGKIVALHIVKQLHRYGNIRVFEPGLARQVLLRYRMVMQSGPSLASSDLLTSQSILGADLIVSGRVFDYQDNFGESKVDFSMQAFNGTKREVIWASRSYTNSYQNVYFFDWGTVPSAHGLTSRMTQAVMRLLGE